MVFCLTWFISTYMHVIICSQHTVLNTFIYELCRAKRGNSKPSLKIGTANAICWNSLGLFRDYGLNYIFFSNKTFLFFKIESWNFQHLFEKEFHETSQNFNSIRQRIQNMEVEIVWMSWNFVRFHEILFQTDAENFSFLYWKQKSFIPKEYIILAVVSK